WKSVFHYVEPDELIVVISKSGDELPPGELLANPGQKGALKDVLGEGRHFVWPVLYEVEKRKLADLKMIIPPSRIGGGGARVGRRRRAGRSLAEDGEEAPRRAIPPPGRHRLGARGDEGGRHDATLIKPGYVGFVTRLVGDDPQGRYAQEGEK